MEATASSSTGRSTVEGLADSGTRAQRFIYTVTTAVLCLLIALALTDAVGLTSAYGVRGAARSASADGYDITVRYPAVTRPGLASPFRIEVARAAGFDRPVTVAVTRTYLEIWDENGLSPAPSAEVADGPWVEWELAPPAGELLTVTFDGRIEPAVQRGRDGAVRLIVDGETLAEVTFSTRVMP